MGRWTTRSFPALLQEMTKLKEKENRTKAFFLPSLGQGKRTGTSSRKPDQSKLKMSSGKHRFASYLDAEDTLPKLHTQQSQVVEQADDLSLCLSSVPDQQGSDFAHDINPGHYEKYLGEGERFSSGGEIVKEGGRQDRRRRQVAAQLSEENSNPLVAASSEIANAQYTARRDFAGVNLSPQPWGDDPADNEIQESQAAVEWIGGSLVPTVLWRKQVSDSIERLSPELVEPEEVPAMIIPQEILDLIPDTIPRDSELMKEMIDVYVKNSPRSKKEAARSGKVPMEILEYEELFRKMTHSARLLFHLGGGKHSLRIDEKKFRCHSIVAAETRNREQAESERHTRAREQKAQEQQHVRKQTHFRGEEASKRESKLKIQREMENMEVKCFCARRDNARDTFLSPRRIAERVHQEASPSPRLRNHEIKPDDSLLERRRDKASEAGPSPERAGRAMRTSMTLPVEVLNHHANPNP